MTAWQDVPEKDEIAQAHHDRIMRVVEKSSFRCPWCGVPVASVVVDYESLPFTSAKLTPHTVSIGPDGLYLNPGIYTRPHHKSCQGFALHRRDMRRFRRAPGFGFGADKDTLDRDWGGW